MKTKFNLFLFFLMAYFFIQQSIPCYSQDKGGNLELAVYNYTGDLIQVMLYPISATINGDWRYTLVARGRGHDPSKIYFDYNYINGVCYNAYRNDLFFWHPLPNGGFNGYNDDSSGYCLGTWGTIEYGNYKLVIQNLNTGRYDSCLIQFDWNSNYLPWRTPGDLYFYLNPDNVTPRFYYRFNVELTPNNNNIEISYDQPNSYSARSWQPNGDGNNLHAREKKFGPVGGFLCEDFLDSGNDISYFPLDARRDCGIYWPADTFLVVQYYPYYEGDNYYTEDRQGVIPLDITIKKKVYTPPDQINFDLGANSIISVEPDVVLVIDKLSNPERGFYINPFSNGYGNDLKVRSRSGLYTERTTTLKLISSEGADNNARLFINKSCNVIIENQAKLYMGDYSQIYLTNTGTSAGKMTFEQNSQVEFYPNSQIIINSYAELRNKGADITYYPGLSSIIVQL